MAQPKVSIIVPVYNVEKYLARCIDSLRNQSLQEIEIILVDDASPDTSSALCDKAAEEDSRIRVIHKPNEGAGMARNTALAVATGTYIGFVDSDDYVAETMFETLYQTAEQTQADLVLSGVVFVDGNMFSKQGECVRKTYFEKITCFETEADLRELRMGIVGSLPGDTDDSKYGMSIWKNLFRREVITQNDLSFQSERTIFSEDGMFMVDYVSHIRKAVGIPEAFYHYCRNDDSVSKSYRSDRLEKGLAFLREVEKNFQKDLDQKEYQIYLNRFWQAFCRVLCSQEIVHATDNKLPYAPLRECLKAICTDALTIKALAEYPLNGLPLKQRAFAYGMKYRLYFLLKILVGLRNR